MAEPLPGPWAKRRMPIALYFVTSEGVYVKVGLTNLCRSLDPVLQSGYVGAKERDDTANGEPWHRHCDSPITVIWTGLRP